MNVFIAPHLEEDVYRHRPLVLVDVGARGGLKQNWSAAARHVRFYGFEPDEEEFSRLASRGGASDGAVFFPVALADAPGRLRLLVARDAGLSSIYEPNRAFVDAFPDADRFDTVDVREVPADALDNVLETHGVTDIDFLKVDTQGSELLVLKGASRILAAATCGLEVEVEFSPIYKDQPLFADVDAYVRGLGYQLFDLRPVYWKRAAGRSLGGPRGQLAWADALYLRTVPALQAATAGLSADLRRSKWLHAVSVSLLYGYADYALDLARNSGGALRAEDVVAVDHAVRTSAAPASGVPGRRLLARALYRLSKRMQPRDDSWSISRGVIGNVE